MLGLEAGQNEMTEFLAGIALARRQLGHDRIQKRPCGENVRRLVHHLQAVARQLHQEPTPVRGVFQPSDQLLLHQPVDLLRDGTGGDQQRGEQVGRA